MGDRYPKDALALHLRRHRKACRQGELTQEELALLSGVSRGTISSLECAVGLPPNVQALVDIALALEVSLDHLIAPAAIAKRAKAILPRLAAAKQQSL